MNGLHSQSDLLKRTRQTMEAHAMIDPGVGVVVGVSGGPDSTALLRLLTVLRNDLDFWIVAAHMDHKLRPESADDADFVARTAATLGVKLHTEIVDIRGLAQDYRISVEEAGRRARYKFFEAVRASVGAAVIATAHHRDDELETFFLRIFRGSSLKGLRGIPPVRGRIIRPLIRATRAEILSFLNEEKIPYQTDRTNLEADTDRNFIRNRIVPLIEKRFPNFRGPLRRTMELIEVENRVLNEQAMALYSRTVAPSSGSLILEIPELLAADEVLAGRVILDALQTLSGPDTRWRRIHVQDALQILRGKNPSARVDLPDGFMIRREYDRLILSRRDEKEILLPFSTLVSGPGEIEIPENETVMRFRVLTRPPDFRVDSGDPRVVYFDADQIQFPFVLRTPSPGDRFRPWGTGGARKLKKVLIDSRVPVKVRRRLPLLVKDDEIVWIPGVRRSASAPIRPDTSLVLEVRLVQGPWAPGQAF